MDKRDPAQTFSNPRLLSAIYFGLLSVVGTILINAFLTLLGIKEIIPLFQAILLGMIVASATGALFGERIVHCPKPYKLTTFWMGFIMVLVSLPLFDLGILYFLTEDSSQLLPHTTLKDLIMSYLTILGYSYVLFGFLLAAASGVAAMYLRGQLVYDILYTDEYRERAEKRRMAKQPKAITLKAHVSRKRPTQGKHNTV